MSKRCEYVLGQAGRRLNEPIHVQSFEHLSQLFQTAVANKSASMGNIDEGALVMIDFFAPWCGPCKAVAPVYHEIATKTPSSLVTFLKIDCDDCDDIARSFDIEAYPTFKLFRVFPPKNVKDSENDQSDSNEKRKSLGINVKELYSVKGIPKPFGRVIAEQIFKNLSSDEEETYERTQKRMEDDVTAAAEGSTIDGVSAMDVAALSTLPLMHVMMRHPMVSSETREQQGLNILEPDLPFDLSGHPQTRSHIAQLMIARMEKDTKLYVRVRARSARILVVSLSQHF